MICNKAILITTICLTFALLCEARSTKKMPKVIKSHGSAQVGKKAPQFELRNEEGNSVKLSDYAGKKVALYFYPMDNTYGCTKQACSLRDGYNDLKQAGITIVGVSADSVAKHSAFKRKQHLPFTLLSDNKQEVAELYGVKHSWLLSWMGPQRITFLINEKGEIVKIIENIHLKDHAQQVIEAFKG